MGAPLTWQAIRALANCELWNGEILTAPFRDWSDPLQPTVMAPPMPAICYTREPWWGQSRRIRPVLASLQGVLVSSFYDPPLTQAMADGMLDGTDVRHWFAVQVRAVHPKLTAMPLGIDRRDLEALVAAQQLPWEDRDILLYANLKPRNAERRQILAQYAYEQDWVRIVMERRLADYFADLGRSRFVLSPPGRAWDCYRTYEALAMGAIPIVRRQPPVSDVVEGLPVLMVDDWREVTRARLEAYEPPAVWNLERMTLPYWVARIEEALWHG